MSPYADDAVAVMERHGPRFVTRSAHRRWLLDEALSLIRFFASASLHPGGGFRPLDRSGHPLEPTDAGGVVRHLHETTRMVHCFAIAQLLGLPGAARVVDHGLRFLGEGHRDPEHGGWFWTVDDDGPTDASKQAYGHAFVILAASSAQVAGHPGARDLFDEAMTVLLERFWDDPAGASTEEYGADWRALGEYRGQNSNMHLTEALMAAFEAFGDARCLAMARRIAARIIDRHARAEGWRVAEHFTADWEVDRDYAGDPMFRPAGTTPGHALEWSRLLVQLWQTDGREQAWMLEAAEALFDRAVETGWDAASGGFHYTLDWSDRPDREVRLWWPCAEGIAAAAVLGEVSADPARHEMWYRRIWDFTSRHVIDREHGGWHPELDAALEPTSRVFRGKPDLYHALQACLIPLLPSTGSITRGLVEQGLRL